MTTHLAVDEERSVIRTRCGATFRRKSKGPSPYDDGDVAGWASDVTCRACVPAPITIPTPASDPLALF